MPPREALLRNASGLSQSATHKRTLASHTYRRNTFLALMLCLVVVGFISMPANQPAATTEKELRHHAGAAVDDSAKDIFQQMQHNTVKIEDCTGGTCTTEVIRVHDTAVLDSERQLGQGRDRDHLQHGSNVSKPQHNSIFIEKEPGKPLVVTVRQNGSDSGQQVNSGGTVFTDDAQANLGNNQVTMQQKLEDADPEVARRASEIADELSSHNAAQHHEGDNVLEIHRTDPNVSNVATT